MSRWQIAGFFRRNAVNIGVVVILLCAGTILFLLANTASHIKAQQDIDTQILNELQGDATQLKTITGTLATNANQRTAQINKLSAQMNCIVLFFSSQNTDRTDKAITDINNCTIQSIANPNSSVIFTPSGASAPSAPHTNPPAMSGGASNPQPVQSKPAPTPTPTPKPVPVPPTPITDHSLLQDIKNLINGL